MYKEDFNRPEIQEKGLFPGDVVLYDDPINNFWLVRVGKRNFGPESFFKIWGGKLVAHHTGIVWFKTRPIDVTFIRRIEVTFLLWKSGMLTKKNVS